MKKTEAIEHARRLNRHNGMKAEVVRILPPHIIEPKDDDDLWDVEVTITEATE